MEARKADGNEGLTVNDVTPDFLRVRGGYGVGPNYEYSPNTDFDWGGGYSAVLMAQPSTQTSFCFRRVALSSARELMARSTALVRPISATSSSIMLVAGLPLASKLKFINQCKSPGARLIPFQPSSSLSYVLEFERKTTSGSTLTALPVLEAATYTISEEQPMPTPVLLLILLIVYANGDQVLY